MELEYKNLKNINNVWIIKKSTYEYNDNITKDYYVVNDKILVYDYTRGLFYTNVTNSVQVFGFRLKYYNKDGSKFFDEKTGNCISL